MPTKRESDKKQKHSAAGFCDGGPFTFTNNKKMQWKYCKNELVPLQEIKNRLRGYK